MKSRSETLDRFVKAFLFYLVMDYSKNLDLEPIKYFCEFDKVFKIEQWKGIPNYEECYEVSDLGRVKSVDRIVNNHSSYRLVKNRILKQNNSTNYLIVGLNLNNKVKKVYVHHLVCIVFLGHIPCGHKLVINHKNFIKTDNRKVNFEIITHRQNTNQKHLKSSSQYVGVRWYRFTSKWVANIRINGVKKYLGSFTNEYDAHLAYEKALKEIIK